jgi:RNA polymerase sigma factor (sigma-70 family)
MVGACERVLRSREEAEDCASEALLAVLQRGGLEGVRNEEAWLVRIAKRRAADAVRRDVRGRRRAVRLAARAAVLPAREDEEVLDQAEARWLAREADRLLLPDQARVLAALADGYTVAEAAAGLGMTKRAAESHLHRARQVLRTAWAATLGVLGWITAGLRRCAPAVPAAAMVVAAVLSAPWGNPGGTTELPRTEDPLVTAETSLGGTPRPAPTVQVGARQARPSARPVAARPARPPHPRSTAPAPYRRVTTPAAGLRLTARDRPAAPADPVGLVMWCAGHATVSLEHIGC